MIEADPTGRADPAEHLKSVAMRLFAERGIDGVTVREIARVAGQKNHAALTYHFGSKDRLVRELIADGARIIDARRHAWLGACEAAGGPHSVREVMAGLVHTSLSDPAPAGGECYNRFVVGLQISHRRLFMEALEDRWNSGYQRALSHVRRLVTELPAAVLNRRLVFMGAAIGGILAGREAELSDDTRAHPMWNDPATLDDIAAALAAIIER